ncbi:hypothetical protein [Luteolibacter marinus]|uniref:hypothetical protein n=1 Tax=Luteolibacter marinus TaxID=2776705 RepID=UPI001868F290|nr:hypothetical protein [Luteolibacter marinus]
MALLALSEKLFAGKIIYIALEASGTSDLATRPVSGSALWLELAGVNSAVHKPVKVREEFDEVDANLGWRQGVDEYTVADPFEIKTRYTTELFDRMRYGLAGAIVQDTPQTPFVKSDRKLRGWVNLQERKHDGEDRNTLAIFCEIRAMDPPPSEKKTQEPMFELWPIYSTLQTVNFPS